MRRAILKCTDEFFMSILQSFKYADEFKLVIENPLPLDIKIVSAGHEDIGVLNLVLESESFDDVKEGDLYPELKPLIFTRINK